MNKHKCNAKDCNAEIEEKYKYCSIECACYDGAFSVRNNRIIFADYGCKTGIMSIDKTKYKSISVLETDKQIIISFEK